MDLIDTCIHGALLGGLYALFAAGLSLMFGVMRIVNLAHGDLGVVASYLVLVVVTHTFLPLWAAAVLSIGLFALIGYATQRTLIQRSLTSGPLATLLVTFGLSIVLQNVLQQLFSADTRTLDSGSFATASIKLTDRLA